MDEVTVTVTLERLAAYQSNDMSLCVTPTTDGGISSYYWANSNNLKFHYDYVAATVNNFLEVAGYPSGEITYEEVEESGDTILSIKLVGGIFYPKRQ